jgi:solute carrier family 10 (sodium/bile acid cotransporter), member 7
VKIGQIKIDNFIVAIATIVIIAFFFPQGTQEPFVGILDLIARIGISLIFFFYGLKLSIRQLVQGLKNWKLHVLIQFTTFLFFPFLILSFYPIVATNELSKSLFLGFLFLAALPSTVSSSVVMVSIAKGNLPAAIFNASISGLIGIAVTPLWMGVFIQQAGSSIPWGDVYTTLLIEILIPVIIGLMLQPLLGAQVKRFSKQLTLFDKSIILLIIYKSFAISFDNHFFSAVSYTNLLFLLLAVIVLFYTVFFFTGFISKKLNISFPDQTTAQFCGTKKSLVHGTVFSKILFSSSSSLGIILLPLMLFHAFQIIATSIIAEKRGREKNFSTKENL